MSFPKVFKITGKGVTVFDFDIDKSKENSTYRWMRNNIFPKKIFIVFFYFTTKGYALCAGRHSQEEHVFDDVWLITSTFPSHEKSRISERRRRRAYNGNLNIGWKSDTQVKSVPRTWVVLVGHMQLIYWKQRDFLSFFVSLVRTHWKIIFTSLGIKFHYWLIVYLSDE